MKIIILYATKYGTTEKAASFLKKQLPSNTDIINLTNYKKNINLEDYDLIIVGGSIYGGKIQKSISNFSIKNKSQLLDKKLALFLCCGNEKELNTQFNNSFDKDLLDHAFKKEYFGYGYNFKKMNFFFKFIVKKMANIQKSTYNIKYKNIEKFSQNIMEVN
ncbi:MAG: flavodoxin domain-containing protein [Fusobacteriota bacterium]